MVCRTTCWSLGLDVVVWFCCNRCWWLRELLSNGTSQEGCLAVFIPFCCANFLNLNPQNDDGRAVVCINASKPGSMNHKVMSYLQVSANSYSP